MASSVNDNILQATGGPSINDGLAIWYGKQPTRSLPDAEKGWLSQRPYTINNASINDMWFSFLRADGYTGSLQDMLKAYWSAPSRVLPTFAGSQYGTIDTPITFTGDFEVEVEFAATDISGFIGLLSSIDGKYRIYINATTGTFTAKYQDSLGGDVFLTLPIINWADGKIHKAIVSRVGDLFSIDIEGSTTSTTTTGALAVTYEYIGRTSVGGQEFIGQILSAKFTDAGTVVANFVFDSGSDLYQLPRGEGLGDDIIFTPPTLVTSPWIDNEDGTFSIDGSQGGAVTLHYSLLLTANKSYECIINVNGRTAGGVRPEGLDFEEIYFGANGSKVFAFTTGTNLNFNIQANNAFDGTVSFTLRQLPDLACLLTNFATTDWNRYTLQRNITHDAGTIAEAWVGDNKVVNGGFDADTDWTKGAGWSIASGVASGASGAASGLTQNAGTISGDIYLAKIDVSGYSAGNAYSYVGSQQGTALSANGSYTEIITDGGTVIDTGAWKDLNFVGDVDDISVQKVLEVA